VPHSGWSLIGCDQSIQYQPSPKVCVCERREAERQGCVTVLTSGASFVARVESLSAALFLTTFSHLALALCLVAAPARVEEPFVSRGARASERGSKLENAVKLGRRTEH